MYSKRGQWGASYILAARKKLIDIVKSVCKNFDSLKWNKFLTISLRLIGANHPAWSRGSGCSAQLNTN